MDLGSLGSVEPDGGGIPMKIYKVADIIKMHPLLAKISSLMENIYQDADGICCELALLEEAGDDPEANRIMVRLEIELEARLDSLMDLGYELKHDLGIATCDPSIGAMNIPCYGDSSRALVYVCFDHTCNKNIDELFCHETSMGKIIPGLTPWNET